MTLWNDCINQELLLNTYYHCWHQHYTISYSECLGLSSSSAIFILRTELCQIQKPNCSNRFQTMRRWWKITLLLPTQICRNKRQLLMLSPPSYTILPVTSLNVDLLPRKKLCHVTIFLADAGLIINWWLSGTDFDLLVCMFKNRSVSKLHTPFTT